ncbi:hypothetical protein KQX54_000024, partial [Cotesia glomerata]
INLIIMTSRKTNAKKITTSKKTTSKKTTISKKITTNDWFDEESVDEITDELSGIFSDSDVSEPLDFEKCLTMTVVLRRIG